MDLNSGIQFDSDRFLRTLFEPYPEELVREHNLQCEIRCLWPKWAQAAVGSQPAPRGWFPIETQAIRRAAFAARTYCENYDVYTGILPRKRGPDQGSLSSIAAASWIWVDIDGGWSGVHGSKGLFLRSRLPKPHIVVESGNGVHCYWRLTEPVMLEDAESRFNFRQLLLRLVLEIGGCRVNEDGNVKVIDGDQAHGDPTSTEVARILRVPDTFNRKRPEMPLTVKLLRCKPEEETMTYYGWSSYLKPFPPVKIREKGPVPDSRQPIPFKTQQLLTTPTAQGQRHHIYTTIAASLAHSGFNQEEILQELEGKAELDCYPKGEWKDLRNIARWATRNIC